MRTETAQDWIDRLHLQPHPEGGYFRETYRAPLILPRSALPGHGGDRAASTAIYFLLAGDQFSAFHRIRSDELWHFYAGSTLSRARHHTGRRLSAASISAAMPRTAKTSRPSSQRAAGSAPHCSIQIRTHSSAAP